MRVVTVRSALLAFVLLALWPLAALAQEAVLSGTVKDTTGAVLPGVTVRAIHESSGNTFEAVTDERGTYRMPVRVGVYRVTAELPGFTTVTRSGVELLVGRTATVDIQMALSAVQETLTVTGEPPLISTTSSSIGGNIDPRQMSELPVQGRGWTALALLAPGNRTTAFGDVPVQDRGDVREFQMNVDGQQVTAELGTGGQPRFSRDAIAEFQFLSNRFDATLGRSMGVQVLAVTKSGTNRYSGSLGGYFRDDSWNAADPVLGRVLPYSNQQISGTFGGPFRRDKFHFFGNYEYEREPRTSVWQTPYPKFNISLTGNRSVHMGGLRLDYQLSPKMRLMGKGHGALEKVPFGPGDTNHPAGTNPTEAANREALVQFTQLLGDRTVHEVRVGYSSYRFATFNLTHWSNHWQAPNGITAGHPRIRFRGFNVLGNSNAPRTRFQSIYMVRDDVTLSYDAKGRHDLKIGAEWLFRKERSRNCSLCMGEIDARGGPVPANIEQLLPDPFNVDTWNLAALSPITRRYAVGVGEFRQFYDQNKLGTWLQDDWQISDRFTLNLGIRYDLTTNAYANELAFPPFLEAGRPDDTNNVQPRVGFAYRLDDRTVLRGGAGLYYGDVLTTDALWTVVSVKINRIAVTNDGRPDFAANPFNGPLPTVEQAQQVYCHVRNAPGCLFRDAQELAPARPELANFSHSWQMSVGVARQLTDTMALEVDYVSNRNRDEKGIQENINLTFNSATGANYPFADRSRRPYPDWGIVGMVLHNGWSNFHGLQTTLTKRFRHRWQASATYLLSQLKDAFGRPLSGLDIVTFPLAPDLCCEYTLAETDQRHRFVFNGIWQVGLGFQVSGIYFYGSGERYGTGYSGDVRGFGTAGLWGQVDITERLRPDGSLVPRNALVGKAVHRVDLRIQRRTRLVGTLALDGIFEVFNLFNRKNFGDYDTDAASPSFGQPLASQNLAYGPRVVQLGFRLTF